MQRIVATLVLSAAMAAGSQDAQAQGFGRAVAVSGSQLLVGEASFGQSPGTVYVYERSGEQWAEVDRLQAPGAEGGDGFGWSLATDGQHLLVSALNPRSGGGGQVHVFTRSGGTWSPAGALESDQTPEGAAVGIATAVRGDLALVTVGSLRGQGGAGVHVFRNGATGWSQVGTLSAPEGGGGRSLFGSAVAFGDGNLFVSDPVREGNAGVVFVYGEDGDAYRLETQISIEDGAGSLFGGSLEFVEGELLVGAAGVSENRGAVIRFRSDDDGWRETGRLAAYDGSAGSAFGSALAASSDRLWVGAANDERRGAVYAFSELQDGSWNRVGKLTIPDLKLRAGLGSTLAVGEGLMLAGLPGDDYGAGTAHVFEMQDDGWAPTQSLFSEVEGYASVLGSPTDCSEGEASVFGCSDVDLVSFVPVADLGGGRGTRVNDVWGWTDPDTQKEYAIVGRTDGTSFVDLSDPATPVLVGNLPKTEGAPGSTWRDMKVYDDHVFIVSDGADHHGMQVFDLTRLRGFDGTPETFEVDAHYDGLYSVHNIVINEETGFAYAAGSRGGGETCGGGLHIIDIRDPKSPTFAGCFADTNTGRQGTGYTHDAQCVVYEGPDEEHQGKEICFGANETALSIADVSDKENTVPLSMASYPNVGYSHQGWLTEDHTFFYMNDELDELQGTVPSTRTLIWDVTDLDDPILVREFQAENRASDHNLYIRGNLMYQSNYQSGLRVFDISDYGNPQEVAFFDTVPGEDLPGMGGSWSNYPFFASGLIIVTSGSEGLFVVRKRERTPVS